MRIVGATLIAALVLIQWPLWFGKGGWLRVWELQRSLTSQRVANDEAAARNNALAAEVRSLKEGREAIEERARYDLLMTRGDEVLFQLVKPGETPAAQDAGQPAAVSTPSPARSKSRR